MMEYNVCFSQGKDTVGLRLERRSSVSTVTKILHYVTEIHVQIFSPILDYWTNSLAFIKTDE